MKKLTSKKLVFLIVFTIFVFAIKDRLKYFDQISKDNYAFERAISDLYRGVNPYKWTIESYSNPDDPGNHGYAYLPGLIYIYAFLFMFHLITPIHFKILWKIPVLLGDIGVGLLLIKLFLDKEAKDKYLALILGLLCWFFNPYMYFRGGYTFADPLTVFFMLLSLYYLKKDNVLSGAFFGIAVAIKTFAYLIFPIFVLVLLLESISLLKKPTNIKKFIATPFMQFFLAGALIGIAISIPFFRSVDDFKTYLAGTIGVHSNRFVQGRPFLYYISYFYKIEFFRIISFKTYTFLATFAGWIVLTILYLLKWIKNRYAMAIIPFLSFYLFTPVLNRTYLVWFIPFLILGAYDLFKKHKWAYYVTLISFWSFYSWYLVQWQDGFHIWHP